MAFACLADGVAAGQGVERSRPSVDPAFEVEVSPMRDRPGQGIEGHGDQVVIVVIGQGQGVVAGEQPAQHAEGIAGMPGALVIDAAAAERVHHEVRAGHMFSPERLPEQEAHPQVVCRPVVTGEVLFHRPAKLAAAPFQALHPVIGQGKDHHVERMILAAPLISVCLSR